MLIDTTLPILNHKAYHAASVFTPENLLREARRQKSIPPGTVPRICILDPDGDIVRHLVENGLAHRQPNWACYHTEMYCFANAGIEYGIVGNVVGGSFAALVAEECFASGCEFLISVTSAGQITPIGSPPYFILIDKALRDEGTSYHYLPPAPYSAIQPAVSDSLTEAFTQSAVRVTCGATWTTDAPFRETETAIAYARTQSILGVEMEAAALYAFAEARSKAVVCFAHITNQMGNVENDFEKGAAQGSHSALQIIHLTATAWLARAASAVG